MQKRHYFSSRVSLWFLALTAASTPLGILKPQEVKAGSVGCTAAPGSAGSEVCLEIRNPPSRGFRGTYVNHLSITRTYVDGIPPIPQNLCNYGGVITVDQPTRPDVVYKDEFPNCARGGSYYVMFEPNRNFEAGSLVCGVWYENRQRVATACNRISN